MKLRGLGIKKGLFDVFENTFFNTYGFSYQHCLVLKRLQVSYIYIYVTII